MQALHACQLCRPGRQHSCWKAHQCASTRRRGRHLQAAAPTPRLPPPLQWVPRGRLLLLLLIDKLRLLHLLLPPPAKGRCCSRHRLERQASPQTCRVEQLSRCV